MILVIRRIEYMICREYCFMLSLVKVNVVNQLLHSEIIYDSNVAIIITANMVQLAGGYFLSIVLL